MPKLTISQLRKIIIEEARILKEGEKEDQAAAMAQNASKLLKAIESFKVVASINAKSSTDSSGTSLEKHLQETEKMLKRIVGSPLGYVDGSKASSTTPDVKTKQASIKPSVEKKA